ncbi:MAG: outer membrane beta-barrel protein [Paracoccaceae bacterium]|nr:outer membrane beta-barrel protein [Paracoccaceae bacterium]
MRSSVKTLLASAAILALPGAALAQDWAGPYGGLTVGYAFGDADHSFSNGAPSDNSTPEGTLIGLFAGYAWQSGSLVYGAEIDFEAADVDGSYVNTTGATSQGVYDQDWQASIRGVLGYAGTLSGKPALYYATAGWAMGDFEFLGGPSVPVPPGGGYSEQLSGWTAGIGMDWMMGANTAMRIEYRYTDFGEASDNLSPTFPGVTMPVEVTQHALKLGVRMNF